MGHLEGGSRDQPVLLPAVLDDDMTADNPVRFMEAFVDGLDLAVLGFQRAPPAITGRPAHRPGNLRTLEMDGDGNRPRSSRRREKEAHRHVEVLWL